MRIGLLRLQVLRPFPAAAIAAALYDSSARLPLLSIVGALVARTFQRPNSTPLLVT